MFQKSRHQKQLILELDYEAESKSMKSSTKMTEQKIMSKFVELYEEFIVQIKNSQNLFLINKIQNLKINDPNNIEQLLTVLKQLVSILVQELIQFQIQVDSQNIEPNKFYRTETKIENILLDNTNIVMENKLKELEKELFQQQELNSIICQELLDAKQKVEELQRRHQFGFATKKHDQYFQLDDQKINEKLKQLHKIYEGKKIKENKQNKLTIMTEPCENETYLGGFQNMREYSTTHNVRSLSIDKYNKTNSSTYSQGVDYFNFNDSFASFNRQKSFKKVLNESLQNCTSLQNRKETKFVYQSGLPQKQTKLQTQSQLRY